MLLSSKLVTVLLQFPSHQILRTKTEAHRCNRKSSFRRVGMTKRKTLRIYGLVFLWLMGMGQTSASAFQLEQRPAEDYIERMERPTRVVKVDEVIAKLQLKPGDIVADIGSRSGTFSIPMAKAIAPDGILYAVDIDQKMLDYVAEKAKKEGVTNLRTVLGEYDDPKLPVRDVDVAFYHRVLHMIEKRQGHWNNTAKC